MRTSGFKRLTETVGDVGRVDEARSPEQTGKIKISGSSYDSVASSISKNMEVLGTHYGSVEGAVASAMKAMYMSSVPISKIVAVGNALDGAKFSEAEYKKAVAGLIHKGLLRRNGRNVELDY